MRAHEGFHESKLAASHSNIAHSYVSGNPRIIKNNKKKELKKNKNKKKKKKKHILPSVLHLT